MFFGQQGPKVRRWGKAWKGREVDFCGSQCTNSLVLDGLEIIVGQTNCNFCINESNKKRLAEPSWSTQVTSKMEHFSWDSH